VPAPPPTNWIAEELATAFDDSPIVSAQAVGTLQVWKKKINNKGRRRRRKQEGRCLAYLGTPTQTLLEICHALRCSSVTNNSVSR
jgi:hypothetical protein